MKTYIKALKERLLDHHINNDLLNEILNEYEEKLNNNNDEDLLPVEEEVENIIIKYDLKLKEYEEKEISTIIALAPFVSLMSYLVLGFGFDLWHPGWLIIIIVPLLFLVFSVFHDDFLAGILALIPFGIILSYFFVGFYYHIWHPTWLIFMLLPVIGVFTHYRRKGIISFLFALSPFLAVILYIGLGNYFHLWSRAWVVFLLVPMIASLHEKKIKRLIIFEASLFVSMIIGIVLPYLTSSWGYAFFGLLIPSVAFISFGEDSIIKFSKETVFDWFLILFLATFYLIFGIIFNIWAYAWMILLVIPVYEIIKQSPDHFKFYYVMPFVSIVLFFSLGYFFDLWAYSWLAFVLIIISYFIERD
ncbi:MAG: hypothetical protein PF513_02085 [Tenericutes bacterium]|jgi:hypothetical protein|nr:hypothetical protein [Mycoplasmatota bacterium]